MITDSIDELDELLYLVEAALGGLIDMHII